MTVAARAVDSSQFERNSRVLMGTSSVCPSIRSGRSNGFTAMATRPTRSSAVVVISVLAGAKVARSGSETTMPRESSISSRRPAAMASASTRASS